MAELDPAQTGDENETTISQYKALLEVSEAISQHRDMESLVRDLARHLRGIVPFDGISILLHNAERSTMRVLVIESAIDPGTLPDELPVEAAPGGWVWQTQQPMLVYNTAREIRFQEINRLMYENGLLSYCVLPLTSAGRRLGALAFGSIKQEAFSAVNLEFLQQVTNQVALAVDNAINFDRAHMAQQQLARERDRLRLLLEVNNAVVSHLSLDELMHAISESLQRVVPHDISGIGLYDPQSGQLCSHVTEYPSHLPNFARGTPIPMEGTTGGVAFTTGQPVFIGKPDFERFHSDYARKSFEAGFNSGGSIPLIAHGRKLGVMGVASMRENAFSQDDIDLLAQIAKQIALAVENALAYEEISQIKNKLAEEKLYLEEEINTAYDFEKIIGSSPALKRILKQLETVAPTDSTVLIQGETGTGKELFARAIHSLSERRERTLVKLNCAAIPTGLLESELFGHEKGAFTGAIAQRVGRFELANRGTLFLDEVGEIPLELQPKLLRVIQEQEFERLGSTRTINVDVRLIAATNRNLSQMVAERGFRDDLYYRLNVFPITIPPLRERREDIPLLVRFFASKFASRMKKRIETIPAESVAALEQYDWPGNIRELENFIERAVILTRGAELEIPTGEMKLPVKAAPPNSPSVPVAAREDSSESTSLESIERDHIIRVLNETDWVVGGANGAAARLGLKRTTLQARMKKLGIAR
jgi:formate hydrogenlyase transcriptional activator